jgi:hypothetical protein
LLGDIFDPFLVADATTLTIWGGGEFDSPPVHLQRGGVIGPISLKQIEQIEQIEHFEGWVYVASL